MTVRARMGTVASLAAMVATVVVGVGGSTPAAAAPPMVTTRVSVATGGAQANGASGVYGGFVDVSGDGHLVVFASDATNLVPGDTNGSSDVFGRTLATGATELISAAMGGGPGNGFSSAAGASADGRYVVFSSGASNLVAGDTNGTSDVFLRDRVAGTTELISVSTAEVQANSSSAWGGVSADGRFVTFGSYATNLVAGDTSGNSDVFVRDRVAGTTERVSVGDDEAQADGGSQVPRISADGNLVFFESDAANLVVGDTNGYRDVFVRDRTAGTTERVSLTATNAQITTCCGASGTTVSSDGRFVVFVSQSNVAGGPAFQEVYLRDRTLGTTERASLTDADGNGNTGGSYPSLTHSVSDDGRYVVFTSNATNMVSGDTNGDADVFVRDRTDGTTTLVSTTEDGGLGNDTSANQAISGNGTTVAFDSTATNLVAGDTNGVSDVFATAGPVAPPGPTSSVYLDDVDIAEGRSGRLLFHFVPPLDATACFRTRMVDGTATRPADYTPNPGRICLGAGTVDAVTGIPIVDDGIDEGVEGFTVELYDLEGVGAGDVSGAWTIVDDPVLITPGAIGDAEGNSGSKTMCMPVRLNRPQATPVWVDWATIDSPANGIAHVGEDFAATSGTLVIPAGQTEGCVAVEIYGDTVDEPGILYGDWLPVHFTTSSQNANVDVATFFGYGLIVLGNDDHH